jgi:uncharacterized protein YchJ
MEKTAIVTDKSKILPTKKIINAPEGYYFKENTGATLYKIPKQGRNEKCACGSGKKFKYCHLKPEVNVPKGFP